jgi:hypothetical protein
MLHHTYNGQAGRVAMLDSGCTDDWRPSTFIVHDTGRTVLDYRRVIREGGVIVRTTLKRRHVLTTRRDGSITFTVGGNGSYYVDTEYAR